MPAEIHKQILDYQGGDANVALELVEKFKPLIKRYAFFLHREDSFEDLQCFLLSMLKTWDTSRLSSTDDATVTRYIANSVKNEYIALSKQKAKERGTSYLEDATLPQALEYAQKTAKAQNPASHQPNQNQSASKNQRGLGQRQKHCNITVKISTESATWLT